MEWPADIKSDVKSDVIRIGIVGPDPFGDAFEPIKGEYIDGKILEIKYFPNNDRLNELKGCHIIFISPSDMISTSNILKIVEGANVLTVSEEINFLEQHGMINFIKKRNKVKFEINKKAANQAGLRIPSKLLRLSRKCDRRE